MKIFQGMIGGGDRIAVTAGSRGISNIALIIKTVCESLKNFGAYPFIVPAMGSHGGATANGQKNVLAEYGITDESMGVPVVSSMEVKSLGTLPGAENLPLYMDRHAFEADAVFIVNRVKAHTDFHGDNESGIAKMLSIGLGKHAQALATHGYLVNGLRNFIPRVAEAVISTGKILGALAVVEDGYDQTSIVRAVKSGDIVRADAELLNASKLMMPSLPFDDIQLLMVDWMGKNISGTGMDPNIIGRTGIRGEPDGLPRINTVCVFDITPESHGNALGIGLADLVPRGLADKVDWKATYENVCTSRFLCRGAKPVTLATDREVVDMALRVCGHAAQEGLKMVRVRDTLHVDEIYATTPMLDELHGGSNVEIAERDIPLIFDACDALQKLPARSGGSPWE
jgi:hypothetical protein